MDKTLYRSKKDRMIGGVVGGLGEYLKMDPTILRLVWVLIVVFTGIFPGVIVYLVAWAIVPEEPGGKKEEKKDKDSIKIAEENGSHAAE